MGNSYSGWHLLVHGARSVGLQAEGTKVNMSVSERQRPLQSAVQGVRSARSSALGVTEQFPDHRQALPEGERVQGRGVRQVEWGGPVFARIVTG